MEKNTRIWLLILFIVSTLLVIAFYKKAFFSSNQYLFAGDGDGLKSYYAYMYHIKYDTSYFQFQGMNYPYGEHILFLDAQPFLTNIIKAISKIFPGIVDYSIGIINWLMIFSFVICSLFCFLVLVEFKLPSWYAAIGAISITILCPQIFRLLGHLAMSYCFFIPMNWYFLLKFFKSDRKLNWSLLIAFFTFIWFYTHSYMGMILVLFNLAIWFFYLIFNFKQQRYVVNNYIHLILQVFVPILLFQLILKITDHHIGRTDQPWGILSYTTNPNSIFIPHHSPFRPVFDKFISIGSQPWEGWAYVGLISGLVLAGVIIITIVRLIQRKPYLLKPIFFKEYRIYLFSGLVLGLYASGFPFFLKWDFLDNLLKPIMQFRSLGRFAWVLYFVIIVYCIYLLFQFFEYLGSRKMRILGLGILIFAHFIYIYEGIPYHKDVMKKIVSKPNIFLKENVNQKFVDLINRLNINDYQAIITLPFYHHGSELYSRKAQDEMYEMSYILSYYTGLPMFNSLAARTSDIEARNIIQMLSPGNNQKLIYNDLDPRSKFLVFHPDLPITEFESNIIKSSKYIANNEFCTFYKISIDSLFSNKTEHCIREYESIKHALVEKDGFLMTDTSWHFIFHGFEDEEKTSVFYNGESSYNKYGSQQYILCQFNSGDFIPGADYNISLWIYGKIRNNVWVIVEETDENGKTTWNVSYNISNCQEFDGDWNMTEFTFTLRSNQSLVKILVHASKEDTIVIDDLLIRPKDAIIYREVKSTETNKTEKLYFNNQYIPLFENEY